jgi:hypothetical protein
MRVRQRQVVERRCSLLNDPAQEFLVLVWLPASMFFYRRKLLDAGTG